MKSHNRLVSSQVDHLQEKQHAETGRSALAEPELAPDQPGAQKWTVMAIVAIGTFMATLDSSIVNISLPAMAHAFAVPLDGAVQWVIIAYLVATAAMLLTAGRLADMVGRKLVWLAGLMIFTISSAFCGVASSLAMLLLARLFQGVGGALLMAVAPAMLTAAFSPAERGRALGLNAITVALGISAGPPLGGLIISVLNWRWIFYVNIPIGILGVFATWWLLKEVRQRQPGRFDPIGAFLLGGGLAALTGALSFGQELGWSSPVIIGALLVSILMLAALPFVEGRVQNPILVFSLVHNRVFASAILSLVLSFLALFAVSFLLPFYLQELRGFSPERAGLILLPFSLTIACVAPFSGVLADRYGTGILTAGGMAITCLGLVLISQLNVSSTIPDILWRLFVTAFGQALFQTPNSSALMGSAPRALQGSASGFLAQARVFGQSLSIAMAGAIFVGLGGATAGAALASQHLNRAALAALQQTFLSSMHIAFLTCAVVAALGFFATLVRGKEERRPMTHIAQGEQKKHKEVKK